MRPSRIAPATVLALSALPSLAQSPEPAWSLSANVGLFSDYRFRGISQTNEKPAIQGGFDFAMSDGLYAGNWNSNVDSAQYNGANVEMDFYGGYKHSFGAFGVDVGGIYYYYPGSGANATPTVSNFELYVGGSWGPLTAKYSYATTDFFAAPDSKGSWYLSLAAAHDFGNGFGINASVGYQGLKGGAAVTQIDGSTADSIVDYKLAGTYTVKNFVLGLAYIGTNRDLPGYTDPARNISNGTVVASLSASF